MLIYRLLIIQYRCDLCGIFNAASHPSLNLLTRIEWQDEQEGTQELRIIKSISHKWEMVGTLLGQADDLDNYKKSLGNDNFKCCYRVINTWIEKNGSPQFPLTWEGVYALLSCADVDERHLAEQMMKAIEVGTIMLAI